MGQRAEPLVHRLRTAMSEMEAAAQTALSKVEPQRAEQVEQRFDAAGRQDASDAAKDQRSRISERDVHEPGHSGRKGTPSTGGAGGGCRNSSALGEVPDGGGGWRRRRATVLGV